MASATALAQQAALEKAFSTKNYKIVDAVALVRAQQLIQQLKVTPEFFVNNYDSQALISEWSAEVTAHRLKVVVDYLEGEQRKENARPRRPAAGGPIKGLPQAMRPTWEDLPDKLDYPTPSAKRQALDPAVLNPGTDPKAGTASKAAALGSSQLAGRTPGGAEAAAGTPPPSGQLQRTGFGGVTPGAAPAGTPGAPPSAFGQRTNKGQTVAVLNDNLPDAVAFQQQRARSGSNGVAVRPVGQPQLDGSGHLFMMEVLDTKVHALDERIMDFADALSDVARGITAGAPQSSSAPVAAATPASAAAGTPGPPAHVPTPAPGGVAGTPTIAGASAAAGGGLSTPILTPGGHSAPGVQTPAGAGVSNGGAAAVNAAEALQDVQPLQHSVADISQVPVWVAGRVLAEAEGAGLNTESLVLEGCREASCGARVRLDVSCLKGFRVFPGQSVCAYGLNPLGPTFIAQCLVTHVPPPPPASAAAVVEGREGGLSLVLAAGPYTLTEDLSYSPLEELLAYCNANPPDVLMLMGPFVDAEHPHLASGTADRTADAVLRDEVVQRLAAWRAAHPVCVVAVMPAVRDVTAPPVLPQPPMTAMAQAVGPSDKAVALQNPSTVAMGPLVVAAGSSDLLKALSAAELSRVPPGTTVERLPALASHVVGQRSMYPLYPAPPGTCLDTSHYSQLQLPVSPHLLLLPSDLAPFAKVLQPATWAEGAPPGLLPSAGPAGAIAAAAGQAGGKSSTQPVVVVNPGRLAKGGAGGTFAHVVVAPGSGPMTERMRVEVKRV